jgi:hypothetical protein
MTKIKLLLDGTTYEAELYEDVAPKTCKALLESLPLEGDATHAAWSGENLFVMWDQANVKAKFEPENQTIYGSNGELLWDIGAKIYELYIAYGQAQYRWKTGNLVPNLFGRIIGNTKPLQQIGKRIQKEGAKKIRITK